jgi:hypothetical protein
VYLALKKGIQDLGALLQALSSILSNTPKLLHTKRKVCLREEIDFFSPLKHLFQIQLPISKSTGIGLPREIGFEHAAYGEFQALVCAKQR